MTGHLLPEDTLAVIRREFYGHRKIIDAYSNGMVPAEGQTLHGYRMAVEAMSKLLEHVEALDDLVGDDSRAEIGHAAVITEIAKRAWEKEPTDANGDLYVKARQRESEVAGDYLLMSTGRGQ